MSLNLSKTLPVTAALLAAAGTLAPPAAADPNSPDLASWNAITNNRTSQLRNNCYNYSTNMQTGTFAQPGKASGRQYQFPGNVPAKVVRVANTAEAARRFKGTAEQMAAVGDRVKAAAQRDGLIPIANLGQAGPGDSVVALVVGYVPTSVWRDPRSGRWVAVHVLDYHWFRRNTNAQGVESWSHKGGQTKATTRDLTGAAITDPRDVITGDESRSHYDRFITFFKFRPGTITVANEEEFLVRVPPGALRILSEETSGVSAGWGYTSSPEIRDLVRSYLWNLVSEPEPGPGWLSRTDGFAAEAGPGALGPSGTLWGVNDQVRIVIRAGIIQITRLTPQNQVIVNYYRDAGDLEDYLGSQAEQRMSVNPLPIGECAADCDTGTGPGTLDIFDFLCFQNRFAQGDPRACDLDTNTGPGVCDIFDFLAFQNAFAGGCP